MMKDSYEGGEITKWSSTSTQEIETHPLSNYFRSLGLEGYYVRTQIFKRFLGRCVVCGKPLKENIWYVCIKDKIYCSEECVKIEYPFIE